MAQYAGDHTKHTANIAHVVHFTHCTRYTLHTPHTLYKLPKVRNNKKTAILACMDETSKKGKTSKKESKLFYVYRC